MPQRHHPLTVALHWFTLAVIAVVITAVLSRELSDDSQLRLFLITLHRSLGIFVLFLAAARLIVRVRVSTKHLSSGLPELIRKASATAQFALYFLLLALPISGWLQASAAGKPVKLLGLIPLPMLIEKDRDFAEQISDLHEYMAWTLIALVVLHAIAALWHHFWRKDHVLRSMLPIRMTQKIEQADREISASLDRSDT